MQWWQSWPKSQSLPCSFDAGWILWKEHSAQIPWNMSDVREKYVSNSTGNPFLILDCTNSFPPSLHIFKVGRYTLGAIIITAKKMALKVWCHWLGLSLLCFLFYIFTFLSHFQFIFTFYFFFWVWRFGVIDALLGRSFSLSTDWTIPGNTSLQLSASASLCITLYHSASLCTTLHQCKMCTTHPSFVHPRIVELCIDAKMFAHCASQLQCTLCTCLLISCF